MPANQPKFTAVHANPGWRAKIAVHSPEGHTKAPKFIYGPVALWLVYCEVVGGFVDAPQAVAGSGEFEGHPVVSLDLSLSPIEPLPDTITERFHQCPSVSAG
jgi:hypothetical protein